MKTKIHILYYIAHSVASQLFSTKWERSDYDQEREENRGLDFSCSYRVFREENDAKFIV